VDDYRQHLQKQAYSTVIIHTESAIQGHKYQRWYSWLKLIEDTENGIVHMIKKTFFCTLNNEPMNGCMYSKLGFPLTKTHVIDNEGTIKS